MTPAVIARPEGSPSFCPSTEAMESRFVCRDVQEPLPLPAVLSNPPFASCRLSVGRSLCNFLPKKDFPADDCLDCLSACVTDGIVNAESLCLNS